ncbi:aquaporin [Chitinophaga pendula]|nr:aquaporin [Chitinophaga pendula]
MQKCIAEFLGTFVLVLMGCGSAVLAGQHVGFLGIAFAFGLSVVSMAYAIGHISGCHITRLLLFLCYLRGRYLPGMPLGISLRRYWGRLPVPVYYF